MAKGSSVRSPRLCAVGDFLLQKHSKKEQEMLACKPPREGQAGAFLPQEASGVGQPWPVSGAQCVASYVMKNEV